MRETAYPTQAEDRQSNAHTTPPSPSTPSEPGTAWPLSMLGMFAIGVRIAVKGRWRGVLRFWPLVAESWAVVTVPAYGIVPGAAGFVGAGHLVIGYATLGVLLARRPHLVLDAD